jgi:L-threonylcarbamoyladenylate synthase
MQRLSALPPLPDPAAIATAADVIRRGGLVAFPTETVYGLGANALDADAVRRLFLAKGRPDNNPLIAHVPDALVARELVADWPERAALLAERFWPGPLTLVLPKRPVVPDLVTAGLPAVAVRVPSHPVALALLRAAALPIAAPSANRFTELSPTTADHVERSLGEQVDVILDGGPTTVGIESTVLDLTGPTPRLLRPGMVTLAELEQTIGAIAPPPLVTAAAPRLSPGMHERHYAPRGTLLLVNPAEVEREAARAGAMPVGALVLSDLLWPVQHPIRMPSDPAAYASRLYAALHTLDDLGCHLILVERPPDAPTWLGVHDRLRRAAVKE